MPSALPAPICCCFLAVIWSAPAAAQSPSPLAPRVVTAARVTGAPPRIDGRLDDPAWALAVPATDFVQTTPDPGALATLPTSARVLYDDDAIYVAMRLTDPRPDSIVAPYPRRDDETTSDWAFVEVDSRFDHRTGFSFGVNPRGVEADGAWTDDVNYDGAWNGVWDAAAAIDSLGWVAEFRIPFSQLPVSSGMAGRPMTWGINFYRYSPHRGESSDWSPRLPSVVGVISHFNRLAGLVAPPHASALEMTPYFAVTGSGAPVGNRPAGSDLSAASGVDIRYRPSGLTSIALSLHPDFGQVEADPSQVNLTTFETFLTEQRPLFVEGNQTFQFDEALDFSSRGTSFAEESPFYSRRVGGAPARGCPASAVDCRVPAATTVLGALRASGRTENGWSGGFFQAWTGSEQAEFDDTSGLEDRMQVQPLTHFSVGRMVREFDNGRAAVGGIATFTGRIGMKDGVDSTLAHHALVLGADGRVRFGGDAWELTGFALASRVDGKAGFTDSRGTSVQAQLTRTSGQLQGGVALRAVSPGFQSNDLGFQRNADWLLAMLHWRYLVYRPGHAVRRWSIGSTQLGTGWTYAGVRRAAVANLTGTLDFSNYWGGSLAWDHEFTADDPEVLRGGPALRLPDRNRLTLDAYTDTRRRWQVTLHLMGEQERGSSSEAGEITPQVTAFVNDRLQIGGGPSVAFAREGWQYAGQGTDAGGEAHYVLARLRQTTASLTARATYAFSSHLTLQLYGQMFLSDGLFDQFREVSAPTAAAPADRVQAIAPARLSHKGDGSYQVDAGAPGGYAFADPAFSDRDMHLNLLLRWEFRPGSTLFLVWTHRRLDQERLGFDLGRDLDRLWSAPGENALQMKISYRLGQ